MNGNEHESANLPPQEMRQAGSNIFELYSVKSGPVHADEPEHASAADRAVSLDRSRDRQVRLCIEYADGTSDMLPYAHLLQISCTSDQHLILCFSHCIISVEGQGMKRLREPLMDEQVRFLRCYNAKHHAKPEDGEPVIDSITRQNIREIMGV